MNKKTRNILLGAMAAIGAIGIFFIEYNYAKNPVSTTIEIGRGDIVEGLRIDGEVQTDKSADLGFQNTGTIIKLTKNVGDFVTAGTVLAMQDSSDLSAQYDQAKSGVDGAKATLDSLHDSLKAAKFKLNGMINDNATSNAKKEQKANIDSIENSIRAQEAAVAGAASGAQNVQDQIAKTIIRAPFDGTVAHQEGEVGEVTNYTTVVLTLMSKADRYEIQSFVSEQDVAQLHTGDKAQVTLDAYGTDTVFAATVDSVDPASTTNDGVSGYKVKFTFDSNDEKIKSGMHANITLKTSEKKDVLEIPEGAIVKSAGKEYVLVATDGLPEQKEVVTGLHGLDGMVEVVSGLDGNEKIIK